MIRPATEADIPAILKMGEAFHAQTGWANLFPYREDDFAASLALFLPNPNFIMLVADRGGLVGMAAGAICPVYFNASHISGEELLWWVSDKAPQLTGLRLLEALEAEAKARGCHTWQMKAVAALNGERMAKLYKRRGYRASEHSFIKRL